MKPDKASNTPIGIAMFRDKESFVADVKTEAQTVGFNELMK